LTFDVGGYWDKECQIDVVGVRKDGWVDIGECKWGAVRSQRQLVGEIDAKVERFPNRRGATICRRLFTRDASSAAARKVRPTVCAGTICKTSTGKARDRQALPIPCWAGIARGCLKPDLSVRTGRALDNNL